MPCIIISLNEIKNLSLKKIFRIFNNLIRVVALFCQFTATCIYFIIKKTTPFPRIVKMK